jgi:hypothetical protein
LTAFDLCAGVLQELEPELKAIYAAAYKGWVELLKHCYKEHAPLNPANRCVLSNASSSRRFLLCRLICRYVA